ncbi:hypothetical protein LINGRAHAP2_LOCUS8294 [Linum grandiflorum]
MLRALSTRISQYKYEKLSEESSIGPLIGGYKLTRSRTLPVQVLGGRSSSYKLSLKLNLPALPAATLLRPAANKGDSKSHPLLSLFISRRKKRTTSRPEFARYIQYVKEGGLWDSSSGVPVMYYK